MNIAVAASVLSSLLFAFSFIWYGMSVAKGKVRVSVSTFAVLAITSASQFVALLVEQAFYAAVFTGLATIINLFIVFVAMRSKNYDFSSIDKFSLAGAGVGLIVWYATASAAWNVYVLSVVIMISTIPLIVKTFKRPESEDPLPWRFNLLASAIFLFTITSTYPIDWIVPVRQMYLAVMVNLGLSWKRRFK